MTLRIARTFTQARCSSPLQQHNLKCTEGRKLVFSCKNRYLV